MVARPNEQISEEEYLALERASDTRHEYLQGKMVAMAGASERHSAIISSTRYRLYGQLLVDPAAFTARTPCQGERFRTIHVSRRCGHLWRAPVR